MKLLEHERNHNEVLLALQANLKDVEKRLNMMNAIEQGIITESTKNRLGELEALKGDCEIQFAQAELIKPTLTKAEIIFWFEA